MQQMLASERTALNLCEKKNPIHAPCGIFLPRELPGESSILVQYNLIGKNTRMQIERR